MLDTELKQLELAIDEILRRLDRHRLEYGALEKRTQLLGKDNLSLLDQKKQAATSLRMVIEQLENELVRLNTNGF